jgi:signal transduction histidine kinase
LTDSSGQESQLAALSVRLSDLQADCNAKDAFIASLSRELNNPLAPVLLAVEHLRSLLPLGDAHRLEAAMQRLERATEGFASRTRVLLDLADLSAGSPGFAITRLDVSDALARVASDTAGMARMAGCTLVVAVAPGLEAAGNDEALRKALGHILANACKFGAGHPVRLAATRAESGGCVITVADQGPGLDADQARSLFALFEQARTPLQPGLGIGLWVAHRLVTAMGGTIDVESTPGRGTHFHVKLPPHPPGAVAPTTQNLQTP